MPHGNPPIVSNLYAFFGHLSIHFWASLIEFVGGGIIVGYIIAALWVIVRQHGMNHGITRARVLVAEGAVWGLNFKLAAALLKTLTLQTWSQFGFFVFIFALRFVVKKVFASEEARLSAELAADRGLPPDDQVPHQGLTEQSDATAPNPLHVRLWEGLPDWWERARERIAEIGRSLSV